MYKMYVLIMHCKPACIHNAVDIYATVVIQEPIWEGVTKTNTNCKNGERKKDKILLFSFLSVVCVHVYV